MPETSFEVQLKALKVRIVPIERLVSAIAGSVPKPLFYDFGQEHFGFRYAKPGVLHFVSSRLSARSAPLTQWSLSPAAVMPRKSEFSSEP